MRRGRSWSGRRECYGIRFTQQLQDAGLSAFSTERMPISRVVLSKTPCVCGLGAELGQREQCVQETEGLGCGGPSLWPIAVSAAGLLPCRVDKEDVMTCLIKGCNFVLKNIPHEAFVYQKDSDPEFRFQTNHPNIFPYLLVNIGSGVSIVKVRPGFLG